MPVKKFPEWIGWYIGKIFYLVWYLLTTGAAQIPMKHRATVEQEEVKMGALLKAIQIPMKHKATGIMKPGYYGFSWTTFFFGFFPALCRSDFITFVGGFIISLVIILATSGIGVFFINVVWAFRYNKYYTLKLVERGYELNGSDRDNTVAASALGIAMPKV